MKTLLELTQPLSQDHHGHGGHREHGHHHQRPSRKRKHKEFASPTGDALIHVDINDVDDGNVANNGGGVPLVPPIAASSSTSASSSSVFSSAKTGTVQIQFDPNTKRLWQASLFYHNTKQWKKEQVWPFFVFIQLIH